MLRVGTVRSVVIGEAHAESLEGARRLASLVANHSGAAVEAQLRGPSDQMRDFPDERSAVRDAVRACDMTTSPTCEPVDFEQRLAETVAR